MATHPGEYIPYGPDENCTLALCDPKLGVYEYRPSLAANTAFLVLFGVALVVHLILGFKWRTFAFTFAMAWGCVSEVIGYGGRILLWQNPFSFSGFLMQIICITLGPTFYTAAIYLTLSKIVIFLGPEYSRFSPKFYYWIFIPCDIISIILQAAGGALSSLSSGGSKPAVNTSLTGLSFQVFTLCVFIGLSLEFAYRYIQGRKTQPDKKILPISFKVFIFFLSLSILVILMRCIYRIDELSDGYNGPLIHNEPLFIGLEGVLIVIAVYSLCIAHPGPVFGRTTNAAGVPDMEEGKGP